MNFKFRGILIESIKQFSRKLTKGFLEECLGKFLEDALEVFLKGVGISDAEFQVSFRKESFEDFLKGISAGF